MKFVFLSILITFSYSLHSQSSREEKLVLYGQIWGFLKYHHPEPGKRNWDERLLKDYVKIREANDSSFQAIIGELIADCKDYTPGAKAADSLMFFPESFSWLESDLLTEQRSHFLRALQANKPEFTNHYIRSKSAQVGNPEIVNEQEYSEFRDDPAYFYLALSRYWNVLNYYFPYRDLIPKDWNNVYLEYLPTFEACASFNDYYTAVLKLSSEIRDGHGFVRTKNPLLVPTKTAPLTLIRCKEGTFVYKVLGDSLQTHLIQKYDKLMRIDGKSIEERWEEVDAIYANSNDYNLMRAPLMLLYTTADSSTITIERSGSVLSETYATYTWNELRELSNTKGLEQKKEAFRFYSDSVCKKKLAYLDMGELKHKDLNRKFYKRLLASDHIIFDVRNYPNGTMYSLGRRLIADNKPFANFTRVNYDHPGSVRWDGMTHIGGARKDFPGNIYILCDYMTQSHAEFTIMSLQQHPRATTIGGQSAGADGNVSMLPLPFGVEAVFSGLGVFYPDRTPTQQVGIRRDIEVVNDFESFRTGKDPFMEKVLELVRSSSVDTSE